MENEKIGVQLRSTHTYANRPQKQVNHAQQQKSARCCRASIDLLLHIPRWCPKQGTNDAEETTTGQDENEEGTGKWESTKLTTNQSTYQPASLPVSQPAKRDDTCSERSPTKILHDDAGNTRPGKDNDHDRRGQRP